MKASRTPAAHVRLEYTLVLFGVYDPWCVKRDGAFGMLDYRSGAARRERRVQNCRLASEVRHAPGDLTRKLVGPREGLHICQPAQKKGCVRLKRVQMIKGEGGPRETNDSRNPGTKSIGAKTSSACVTCARPRAMGYTWMRRWVRWVVSRRAGRKGGLGGPVLTVIYIIVKYLRRGTILGSPANLDMS